MLDAPQLLARIRERLEYDPSKGAFYRKPGFTGTVAGARLGSADSSGKRQAAFCGQRFMLTQLVWLWETGSLPAGPVTHVNGDNSDDRFCNLKLGRRVAQRKPKTPKVKQPKARKIRARKSDEEKRATKRAYMQKHPELYREAMRKYRAKLKADRPEEWAAMLKAQNQNRLDWLKTPKGRIAGRLHRQRRRARTKALESKGVTAQQWQALSSAYVTSEGDTYCAYCKAACAHTIDHVVPISRGGLDEIENVLPACSSCNSSKCNKLIHEWHKARHYLTGAELDELKARSESLQCKSNANAA